MKNNVLSWSFAGLLGISSMTYDPPKGWITAGSEPKSYEMGIDHGAGPDGNSAATLKSVKRKIKGFGTLMQVALAENYVGKRIRMTGMMKTKDVKMWCGFWLRVDGSGKEKNLSFDNMKNGKTDRSVSGTTPWTSYDIVLDVPLNAVTLNYGALLGGTGQIWFDKIKFEIVADSVPVTGLNDFTPAGWVQGGRRAQEFWTGVDSGAGPGGSDPMTIRSLKTNAKGFGTLTKTISTESYKGKRIRMTGMMKMKDVHRWAGIIVRVDQRNTWTDGKYYGKGKKVKSEQEKAGWVKYEIVFEVPVDSKYINYGGHMTGTGQIWFDNIQFEIVDESVPLSPGVIKLFMPEKEPINLDFEKK